MGMFDDKLSTTPPPFNPRAAFGDAHARKTDPATSKAAAASLSRAALTEMQEHVFALFVGHGPMTHDKAIERYKAAYGPDVAESTVRSRVAELVERKMLKDTGITTNNARGRQVTVWGINFDNQETE